MVGKGLIVILGLAAGAAALADETPAKPAGGDAEVKKLLLLMDKDQNGKVSREEFMNFMGAEFDRLDVNKDGELDVNELSSLRVRSAKKTGGAGSK